MITYTKITKNNDYNQQVSTIKGNTYQFCGNTSEFRIHIHHTFAP